MFSWGPSRCDGWKKNGTEYVGRSRGGPTTKIHAACDSLGNPLRVKLTEGQVHDIKQAPELLGRFESTTILADKGYDSDPLVARIETQGCAAVIPPRAGRKNPREHGRALYKHGYLVEILFQKIKRYRRVATRYEKLGATFLGMVQLACVLVWLR